MAHPSSLKPRSRTGTTGLSDQPQAPETQTQARMVRFVPGSLSAKTTYVHPALVLKAALSPHSAEREELRAELTASGRVYIVSAFHTFHACGPLVRGEKVEATRFVIEFLRNIAKAKVPTDDTLIQNAAMLVASYDFDEVDALHTAAAVLSKADEYLTLFPPEHPAYRLRGLPVVSLYGRYYGVDGALG